MHSAWQLLAHLPDVRSFLRAVAGIFGHLIYNGSGWGQGRGIKRHAREFCVPLAVHMPEFRRKSGRNADAWTLHFAFARMYCEHGSIERAWL